MKLTIELIPEPCHGISVHRLISTNRWAGIRKALIERFSGKCAICGTKSDRLNCHEEWEYDDEYHVRTLNGIIPLCEWCHWVKHASLAKGKAGFGEVDFPRVVQQFVNVNRCSHKVFFSELDKAIEICEERSKYEWQTDFGEYADVIDP